MKLYATQRLLATEDAASEVHAEFNKKRDGDLRNIQVAMRKQNLIFSFGVHHLFHKSNPTDVIREAQKSAEELNRQGYNLRIDPGIFGRQVFALKGKDGLVLQRVNHNLRIFFHSK
jgi:hypothetical protein